MTQEDQLSLDEIIEMEGHLGIWLIGSDQYAVVCGFIQGAMRARPDLLLSLPIYVVVNDSRNKSMAWPLGIALRAGYDARKTWSIIRGEGSSDENALLIGHLFDVMREYRDLVRSGGEQRLAKLFEALP